VFNADEKSMRGKPVLGYNAIDVLKRGRLKQPGWEEGDEGDAKCGHAVA